MGYVLSVDGGGTKTEFCIYHRETKKIWRHKTGSGNFKAVGIDEVRKSLHAGAQWFFDNFKITPEDLEYSVFGMSGCDADEDYEIVRKVIESEGYLPEKTYLCNDGELAFYAQAKAPGIVIIAGTGSIVIGVDKNGKSERAGGWGYGFSDLGSGYWIGNEALKNTLLYCDGCRPYSRLYDGIRDFYGINDFKQLPYCITQIQEYPMVAKAAVVVVELAEKGVKQAKEILSEGAEILATQAASVYRRMNLEEETLTIVCAGGTISEGYYRKCLEEKLQKHFPEKKLVICEQKNPPCYGGIHLAMERKNA